MLGHSQPATTARYAHLADDPVKAATDAVGRHIAAAMDGGNRGEVVGLSRSRTAAIKPRPMMARGSAFSPKADIFAAENQCPLSANSGHPKVSHLPTGTRKGAPVDF
jgi:hypothetical protein